MLRHSNSFLFAFLVSLALAQVVSSARAGEVKIDDKTFKLPDGFTIERVAGPPLVDRPIVADFDEQGRLYIADSSGSSDKAPDQAKSKPNRIVTLDPADADGFFRKGSVFAQHLPFPEGAMWYAGSLYVGAPPSIWKLTDSNGSGLAEQLTEWFQGKTVTGCGNDLHGPYLGPDGWIYWCKGAFAEQTYARPGHKPFVTKAAHIFRSRPDGSGIEPVMTGGMDNPVHVVFTPGGERIFTTTFLVNPAGGQRDGIIHAVYGGIYGKVHDDVLDDHPHTSPDLMPVLVHLGPAACCGLARYESNVFGKEYENNLFATCFNLHKVTRHVLTPDGATFSSQNEDFLTCDNVDFHPTDIIEDADGSLLVIDTGGWYHICCPTSQFTKPDVLGAIYRIKEIGAKTPDDPRGLKLSWDTMKPEQLAALLNDPRPAVQTRAIAVIATKGDAALEFIRGVLDHGNVTGRLNAVWAATRIDGAAARAVARHGLGDQDATVRQAATHSASLWRDKDAEPRLLELLTSSDAQNQRVAAEALGRIGDGRAVAAILAQLAKPNDHVLDHSLTYALIEIADVNATAVGLSSSNPRVRRAAMMALDQMEGGHVEPTVVTADLGAADTALRETAAWIAVRHPEWGGVLAGALGKRIEQPNLSSTERTQLEHQLARLAKSSAIESLLANIVQNTGIPADQRRLALAAMAQSSLKPVPEAWVSAISTVLSSNDPSLLPDAVATLRKLNLDRRHVAQVQQKLLTVAAKEDLPAAVRLDALAAAPGNTLSLDQPLFAFVLSQLAPSQPSAQRITAAQVVGRAKLNSEQLNALTDVVKTAGPFEIDRLLTAFAQSSDDAIGKKLVAALKESKALTAIRADALQARLAKFSPTVRKEAEPLLLRLNPDLSEQKAKIDELTATLPIGDVRRGESIFKGAKVACSTCHALGYVGGNVGPDLTRIGAIRQKRDLLESIIYPSASFVQSYEPMLIDTKDGDRQSGIIRRNDSDEVVLITGPNQELHILRANIREIHPGTVSVMPSGLDQQLSKQELADLVAFLQACK